MLRGDAIYPFPGTWRPGRLKAGGPSTTYLTSHDRAVTIYLSPLSCHHLVVTT